MIFANVKVWTSMVFGSCLIVNKKCFFGTNTQDWLIRLGNFCYRFDLKLSRGVFHWYTWSVFNVSMTFEINQIYASVLNQKSRLGSVTFANLWFINNAIIFNTVILNYTSSTLFNKLTVHALNRLCVWARMLIIYPSKDVDYRYEKRKNPVGPLESNMKRLNHYYIKFDLAT